MLLSALDPALLFYRLEDWQNRETHCFDRFGALGLHFEIAREYGQNVAMSDDLESLMYRFFPWNADFQRIGELHDLLNFMLDDMQKVKRIIHTKVVGAANLEPAGILCEYVEAPEVLDAWKELLCGCVDEANSCKFQIATWETPAVHQYKSVTLTIVDPEEGTDAQYDLPLVWDDDSWAIQLAAQDWWPDLQRCVEFEFKTNHGIRNHPQARSKPIPFQYGESFLSSLDRLCTDPGRRRSLVEALTKRVYGVHVGLGDEQIKNIRRFRVTDFWRVHYRMEGEQIMLLEFGPHSMGGVD